MYQFTVSIFEL